MAAISLPPTLRNKAAKDGAPTVWFAVGRLGHRPRALIARNQAPSLHRGQKGLCHELPGLVIHLHLHFRWPSFQAGLVG